MNDIAQGRYRHYKGNEYTVLGLARHSETHEELVVYRQEYGDHGLWGGQMMRPQPLICVRDVEASGRWYQRLVRRMLARRSHDLLERYQRGEQIGEECPLRKALAGGL